MNGILILDKPAGITSHDACDEVKRILNVRKAGHAGTLDPMVTGVLVIALEDSTKALRLFSGLPKKYTGKAHVHADFNLKDIEKIIKSRFLGKIKQTPPKKSRVKREEREREIFEFKILNSDKRNFNFLVSCEAGTYIRKLIDDLGKEMKIGMHMASLRRIEQGPFSEKESIKIETLEKLGFSGRQKSEGFLSDLKNNLLLKKSLLNLEEAIKRLNVKIIQVNDEQEHDIKQGKFINSDIQAGKELIVAMNKNKVIALMEKRDDRLKPERVF